MNICEGKNVSIKRNVLRCMRLLQDPHMRSFQIIDKLR